MFYWGLRELRLLDPSARWANIGSGRKKVGAFDLKKVKT